VNKTVHECRHPVAFNTQAVAEDSLNSTKGRTDTAALKVAQCPECGWWLIVKKASQ
jgi:hypothetical protein